MVEVRIQNTDELVGYCDFTPDPARLASAGRFPTGWRHSFAGPDGAEREFVLMPLAGRPGTYAFYARSAEEAGRHLPGFTPLDRTVGRGDRLDG
ncbi:MAG: hypothetical protein AB1916_08840 [Thermodesulfobacteriota bacterium]